MKSGLAALFDSSPAAARWSTALLATAPLVGTSAESVALDSAEVRETLNALVVIRDDSDTAHARAETARRAAHSTLSADSRVTASMHYSRAYLNLEQAHAIVRLAHLSLRDTVIKLGIPWQLFSDVVEFVAPVSRSDIHRPGRRSGESVTLERRRRRALRAAR